MMTQHPTLFFLVIALGLIIYCACGGSAIQKMQFLFPSNRAINSIVGRILVFLFWPVIGLVGWIAYWLVLILTGFRAP